MRNIYNLQNSNDPIYYDIMQILIYDLNDCLRIIFDIPYIHIRNEKLYFTVESCFEVLYKLMNEPTFYNALILNMVVEKMNYDETYLNFIIEYYLYIKSMINETVGR